MKLEVFFDYACPFCLKGYQLLLELLPDYPELEVEWHPCEAHPRPERYGVHSDLCARGMFLAQDSQVDLKEYHQLMYRAAVTEKQNIEDVEVLAELVSGLMDARQFSSALNSGKYIDQLTENNRLAWERYGFPAVPSLKMGEQLLPAVENIGLDKAAIKQFIDSNRN